MFTLTNFLSKEGLECQGLCGECSTLKRLLDTLDTAFEAVLEFLEVALEPSPDSLGDGMLTLAALKCLCRCSEQPEATSI